MKTITYESEKKLIEDVLKEVGIGKLDSNYISNVLVEADLRGIRSHGIARLPIYVKRLDKGLIEKNTKVKKVRSKEGMALFDGGNCMGQIASVMAMEECIRLSKEYGVSVVGLRNSNHFGIAAYYSMMASKENVIGFVATNTSPLMAPFGGYEAMLGTNPFTVAIPANERPDIVLDMATSLVPRGKIEVHSREGKSIPIGWGITKDGKNTENPDEVLEGTLLPVGGPKGYGMAIVVDILSGLLTGATYLDEIGSLFNLEGESQNLGMFMVCIDPSVFMEIDEFKNKIDKYIEKVKNSAKSENVAEIFLPGEIEYNTSLKNRKKGIEIDDALYKSIDNLMKDYGLEINEYLD